MIDATHSHQSTGDVIMLKMEQKQYNWALKTQIRFEAKSSKYLGGMQEINILSRHHKRIVDFEENYRNKYAVYRWINDSRGCGYACLVAKKRMVY